MGFFTSKPAFLNFYFAGGVWGKCTKGTYKKAGVVCEKCTTKNIYMTEVTFPFNDLSLGTCNP